MVDRAKGDEVEVLRVECAPPTEADRRALAAVEREAREGRAVSSIAEAMNALRVRAGLRPPEAP